MSGAEIGDAGRHRRLRAVVIGGSAGGFEALAEILAVLPESFPVAVLVAQHLHRSDRGGFAESLNRVSRLAVVEPCDKVRIEPGYVYVAPANYHMLVERGETIALSVDEAVNWSRPSIDVLFESAAAVWKTRVVAVILSGANSDGTRGMGAVQAAGGETIAQTPASASSAMMPRSAIEADCAGQVLAPRDIGLFLAGLAPEREGPHDASLGKKLTLPSCRAMGKAEEGNDNG